MRQVLGPDRVSRRRACKVLGQCRSTRRRTPAVPDDVPERFSDLFVRRGVPGHIRPDNGPEFTAEAVRDWPGRVGAETRFIEPGSPWEDGHIESSDGKLWDELLGGEEFDTL